MKLLGKLRVLVANEPCTYREAISTAFGELRPRAEVSLTGPEDLDREVARLSPHLVLCSRTTEAHLAAPLTWMVLYPDGEDRVVIDRCGEEPEAMTGACFNALLEVLDETEDLYESAQQDSFISAGPKRTADDKGHSVLKCCLIQKSTGFTNSKTISNER